MDGKDVVRRNERVALKTGNEDAETLETEIPGSGHRGSKCMISSLNSERNRPIHTTFGGFFERNEFFYRKAIVN